MKSSSLLAELQKLYPDSSKNTLKSWIEQGRIVPDEKGGYKLLPKTRYTTSGSVKILYRDRYLVVLDKPEGVLSVKTAFEKEDTLYKYVKETFGNHAKVVHRLDQGTSGVILFALEKKTYETLKKMFENHELDRRYTAIVEGELTPKEGVWISYLWQDQAYKMHASKDPEDGKKAITHYKVLKASKHKTIIECRLETGRKNQIRVQAKEAGHPVLGDQKYGAKKDPLKRLALHAHSIEFLHPILKKKIFVESELPKRFLK